MQNFIGKKILTGIGLCIALLLHILPIYADTFYVNATTGNDANNGSQTNPWRTIAKAAQSVSAGTHTIMVAAGTYNEETFALAVGVSLQGAGISQTFITNKTFTWWQGGMQLVSSQITDGNQSVSGFTFSGDPNSTFSGIQVRNRNNVKIFNVKVELFYHAGIEIMADYGLKIKNIEIADFIVSESSRESGGACYGNILGRGNIENIQIHDGAIYHQTNVPVGIYGERTSGYAIKFTGAYGVSDFSHTDYVSKSKIYNIKQYGKANGAWGGSDFPNLGIEFWHVGGAEVEIYNCDFTSQISLEYEPPVIEGAYSFWVRGNRFKVFTQQSIEITTSNAIIEDNIFDYRDNTNPWNVMGEYNKKDKGGDNIHVRKNYFILGASAPVIWAVGNAAKGLYFYNNTITGTSSPALFQIRSTCGTNASEDLRVFNNVFDLGTNGANITTVTYEPGTSQPKNVLMSHNHHSKPFTDLPNETVTTNNKEKNPSIARSGNLPLPFLSLPGGSELIDGGLTNLPLAPKPMSFGGNAPDIGAFESNSAVVNQPPTVSLLSPAGGASFDTGNAISISTNANDGDGSIAKVEFFAGTIKLGEATAAPWSYNWTSATVGSHALTAKATDDKGASTTSSGVNITVKATNQAPVVAISSPVGGATFIEGANVTVTASATDSDGSVTKVEFFANSIKLGEATAAPWSFTWNTVSTGSYTLTAKATDDKGNSTTSASVDIVVNTVIITPPNQAPVVVISSPVGGATFTEGANITVTANVTDSDGNVTKVEFFVGTTKLGEATGTPWNFVWNTVAIGSYTLTAKATDDKGASTTSASVDIVVNTAIITPPNQAPMVALSSPTNGTVFTEGTSVTLTANATDSDGSVVKVEYFAGTTKLGEATAAPWSYNWASATVGSHALTAKATDNKGATTVSQSVSITVQSVVVTPPNQSPVVAISSPVGGATFTEGANVTVTASATDSEGSVTKVEFFANSIKLGEATAAPWSFTWNTVSTGSYTLTAKATDDKGASTTSASVAVVVEVRVVVPNKLPTVAFISPRNGGSFVEGSSVTIMANATDADGTVVKVEFFAGTTKVGEATGTPWICTWNNVPAGVHMLTAEATDNQGGTNVATAVSVMITPAVGPPAVNVPPTVSIGTPLANSTHTEGAVVVISTTAADSDGSVVKVEYFAGTTKLGEATAAPWSYNWSTPAKGIYTLSAKATDNQGAVATSATVTITIELVSGPIVIVPTSPVPTCSATGTILREVWNNIPSYMSTMIPVYKQPDNSIQLSSFEGPTNVGDNYSSRIRGYICPPADGAYTFWISGSDQGDLWLSVNEDPSKKAKIAYISTGTNPLDRTRSATQQSAPIRLLKGKKYYIEATHKARKGNDNLAVSWKLPNGTVVAPIAGSSLSPYLPKEGEFDAPPLQVGQLNVFPNPADNLVNLHFAVGTAQSVQVKIINTTFQEVITFTKDATTGENTIPVNISTLSKGIYIVYIQTKEGRLSKKLLVYH